MAAVNLYRQLYGCTGKVLASNIGAAPLPQMYTFVYSPIYNHVQTDCVLVIKSSVAKSTMYHVDPY